MEEKIMDILVEICDDQMIRTNKDLNIVDAGLIDSMGYIQLLVQIEEDLGIYISPTELTREEMDTPNKIIAQITARSN